MKNIIILLLILFPIVSLSQSSEEIDKMDECDFFEFVKKVDKDDYHLYKVSTEFKQRKVLLNKLESYIIYFNSFEIAPVILEPLDTEDPFSPKIIACARLQKSFNDELKTLPKYDARRAVQKNEFIDIYKLFIKLLDLNNSNNEHTEKYIAELNYPFTVEFVYLKLNSIYFIQSKLLNEYADLPKVVREDNLNMLSKRLEYLDNRSYSFYKSYHSKPQAIKGFEMYHDNDVFLFSKMNQDREYTGGFKFTVVTDHLKWRWLRLSNLIGKKSEENILTYQTFSLGGFGYTPYIRYRNNFALADTIHTLDRPFSSYIYLERAKHRTWRKGLVRHKGEFQVGAVGLSQGSAIQAKLHEDVIHESQFVYGWEKQIANGGRLAIQANHQLDFMLYSQSNRYATIFRPNTIRVSESNKKYSGHNIIGEVDMSLGTVRTTMGVGLRYSTLNFLQQSHHQMITSHPSKSDEFGIKFDFGIKYRYVVHNAMLEGLGFMKPFPFDEYDILELDKFVLNSNELERNLLIVDFGINIKFRKTTVFYRQLFHNLEYKSRLETTDLSNPEFVALIEDNNDIDFYSSNIIKEQNDFLNRKFLGKTIYGFGTLGISWVID